MVFTVLAAVYSHENAKVNLNQIFMVIAGLLYTAQIIESLLSNTATLLWRSEDFNEFGKFKEWFLELKKCRPTVSLVYKLSKRDLPQKAGNQILPN